MEHHHPDSQLKKMKTIIVVLVAVIAVLAGLLLMKDTVTGMVQ